MNSLLPSAETCSQRKITQEAPNYFHANFCELPIFSKESIRSFSCTWSISFAGCGLFGDWAVAFWFHSIPSQTKIINNKWQRQSHLNGNASGQIIKIAPHLKPSHFVFLRYIRNDLRQLKSCYKLAVKRRDHRTHY